MFGTITKTQYKISDFLAWQRSGGLILSPKFQRRPVWPAKAKSFLLDSVIRGFPIPIIFLRERKTDLKSLEARREVVDGQQRIRTLLSFIDADSLPDYNPERDGFVIQRVHNPDYADFTFSRLPPDVRRAILDYEFSVHILSSSTGDREIIQLFARMNSTGYKLNEQELRNAYYFGEFKTSMLELSAEQLQRWRDWGVLSETDIARMQEVELVSELAQLMLVGIKGKSQRSLDALYEEHDETYPERGEVERRFRIVMDAISDVLGSIIGQTVFTTRPRFYGLFAFVYDVLFGIGSPLKKVKAEPVPKLLLSCITSASEAISRGTAPQRVLEALARRTTHPESRRLLIDYLKGRCGIA